MNNERIERIKVIKLLLALSVLIIGYFALNYVFNTGQLTIAGLSGSQSEVSIMADGYNNTFSTDSTEYSTRLPTGKYTITVKNGQASFVKAISIGRFLTKETVTAELTEESKREFVADNPRSCIAEVSGYIATYTCNGPVSSLVIHLPADTNKASTTVKLKRSIQESNSVNSQLSIDAIEETIDSPSVIESVLKIGDKTYLLLYLYDEQGTYHTVYEVAVNNNVPTITFLKTIDGLGDGLYQATSFNDQIILSNPDGSKVIVGSNFDDLALVKDEEKTDAVSSSYRSGVLARVYSETEKGAQVFELPNGNSILTTEKDGKSNEKTIDKNVLKMSFCGELLCVLTDDKLLTIYNDSLGSVATIPEIEELKISNDLVYLLKNNQLIEFDTRQLQGYIVYSTDTFKLSSFSTYRNELYVTIDSGNKQHLLRVSAQAPDYTDRAVSPLFNNGFINTVSVYKNYIFVVPELGQRVQTEDGTYEYDEVTKDAARESINASLSEISGLAIDYNVRVFIL